MSRLTETTPFLEELIEVLHDEGCASYVADVLNKPRLFRGEAVGAYLHLDRDKVPEGGRTSKDVGDSLLRRCPEGVLFCVVNARRRRAPGIPALTEYVVDYPVREVGREAHA